MMALSGRGLRAGSGSDGTGPAGLVTGDTFSHHAEHFL